MFKRLYHYHTSFFDNLANGISFAKNVGGCFYSFFWKFEPCTFQTFSKTENTIETFSAGCKRTNININNNNAFCEELRKLRLILFEKICVFQNWSFFMPFSACKSLDLNTSEYSLSLSTKESKNLMLPIS